VSVSYSTCTVGTVPPNAAASLSVHMIRTIVLKSSTSLSSRDVSLLCNRALKLTGLNLYITRILSVIRPMDRNTKYCPSLNNPYAVVAQKSKLKKNHTTGLFVSIAALKSCIQAKSSIVHYPVSRSIIAKARRADMMNCSTSSVFAARSSVLCSRIICLELYSISSCVRIHRR